MTLFIKEFPLLTADQVVLLFEHARAVAAALAGMRDVVFPTPRALDGRQITYDFLDLPSRLDHRLLSDALAAARVKRVGEVLRQIHAATGDGGALLHSDFVAHNIFDDGARLFIIDPHPPERLPFALEQLWGDPRRELVAFVGSMVSAVGLRHLPRRARLLARMTAAFCAGYGPQAVPSALIAAYARDVYMMKRLAGHARWHAALHAVTLGVVTRILLWLGRCAT